MSNPYTDFIDSFDPNEIMGAIKNVFVVILKIPMTIWEMTPPVIKKIAVGLLVLVFIFIIVYIWKNRDEYMHVEY